MLLLSRITAGAKSDGEAWPLVIAETSVANPVGEAGEVQPPVTAKCSATTVATAVATSFGLGEARLPEFAKHSAAAVAATVAMSVDDGKSSASWDSEVQGHDNRYNSRNVCWRR